MESKRKYFEIWGDLEAQNRTLKTLLIFLVILLFLNCLFSFLTRLKPPVVIRVNEVGKAAPIPELKINNAVSEVELIHFAKCFVKKYTAYNAYTIAQDMAEAFNMMTSRYQKIAHRDFLESGLGAKVKEGELHSKIVIREVNVEKDHADYALISILGVRQIMSYKLNDFRQENLFKAEIVMKKVPRTLNMPYGLLVEDYHEVLVKEIK